MRKYIFFIILIALCSFVLLLSCLYAKTINKDEEQNPNPFKLTVDSTGNVGTYTSLAVDSSNVYISYSNNSNDDLKFAKSVDGGNNWISTLPTGDVGLHTSLTVDDSNIYISYFDTTSLAL